MSLISNSNGYLHIIYQDLRYNGTFSLSYLKHSICLVTTSGKKKKMNSSFLTLSFISSFYAELAKSPGGRNVQVALLGPGELTGKLQ